MGRSKQWTFERTVLPSTLMIPAILIMLAIVVAPLVYSLVMGWYDWSPLKRENPKFVGLNNYIKLFHDTKFWFTVQISARYVLMVMGISSVLGFIIAYAISVDLPGMKIIRSLTILPLMVSPVVVGLIWRLLYDPGHGIINYGLKILGLGQPLWIGDLKTALISVALVSIWQIIPFAILVFLAGLNSLPIEPYEAAMVDGASSLAMFRYLTIPLMRKYIILVVLFLSVDAMKAFDTIYALTRGGPGRATEVSSMYAYNLGFKLYKMGPAYAMSHIILGATIILGVLILVSFRERSASSAR